MDIIKSIEHEQLKNKIPELKVGNTVKVHVRIKEGNKERIQVFEGIIIKVQGGGLNQTFTVRKTSYGVGVEKTFLIHSPLVEKRLYGHDVWTETPDSRACFLELYDTEFWRACGNERPGTRNCGGYYQDCNGSCESSAQKRTFAVKACTSDPR